VAPVFTQSPRRNRLFSSEKHNISLDFALKSLDFRHFSHEKLTFSTDFGAFSNDFRPKSLDLKPFSTDFRSFSTDFIVFSTHFSPSSTDYRRIRYFFFLLVENNEPGKTAKNTAHATDRQSTDWDIKNAPKNYASLVVAQGGTALFSFASVWILTKFVGAEGYGGVAALLLGAQLAQIPIMWTGNALSRFGVQEFVETGKITNSFWSRTIILVPNLALIVLISPIWFPPLAAWLKIPPEFLPLLLFNLTATAIAMHAQAALQGAKLLRLQSALTFTERVLIFLTLTVLAVSGALSLTAAILAYSVAPLLVALFSLFKLSPLVSRMVLSWETIKKIVIFSLPIPLFSVVSHLAFNHLDAIFILRYLSTADLGVYSVAYQLNFWVGQLSYFAGFVLMPMLVTSQTNRQQSLKDSYFRDLLPAMTFCFGILSVFIALGGYFVLPYILSPGFAAVGPLLIVFAAACAVSVPIQAGFSPLAYSESATYIQLVAGAVGAIANVVLNILLIPSFGLIGCVWATVISGTLNMLLFGFLVRRRFRVPFFSAVVAPLPVMLGAIVYTVYGDIVIFSGVVLAGAVIMLFLMRNSFLRGAKKLKIYR